MGQQPLSGRGLISGHPDKVGGRQRFHGLDHHIACVFVVFHQEGVQCGPGGHDQRGGESIRVRGCKSRGEGMGGALWSSPGALTSTIISSTFRAVPP